MAAEDWKQGRPCGGEPASADLWGAGEAAHAREHQGCELACSLDLAQLRGDRPGGRASGRPAWGSSPTRWGGQSLGRCHRQRRGQRQGAEPAQRHPQRFAELIRSGLQLSDQPEAATSFPSRICTASASSHCRSPTRRRCPWSRPNRRSHLLSGQTCGRFRPSGRPEE
jgi:hypothetical protein